MEKSQNVGTKSAFTPKKLGRLRGLTSVGWKRLITYRIQETKHGWRATDPSDAY